MLALTDARVYIDPALEPLNAHTVLIEDGIITACWPKWEIKLPQDCETLDCSGLTVTAAFWNSHVHFFERKWADAADIPREELESQLRDFTRYGFAAVFDLSSGYANTSALRARIESGDVAGPRVCTTGPGLVPPGALPPDIVNRVMGIAPAAMPEIAGADAAAQAIDAALAAGPDAIKVFASGNAPGTAMALEAMECAIERAHAGAKQVFVHVNSEADVRRALACGADVIAHTTPRTPWSDETLDAVHESSAAMTPTLKLWNDFLRHDRLSVQTQTVNAAVYQLRAWIDCGREVLFGTDYGAVDADPRTEYALMHAAGMDSRAILAALTTTPAQRFAPGERTGRIARGYRADVTVLRRDPANDPLAFADVAYTLRSGRVIFRS